MGSTGEAIGQVIGVPSSLPPSLLSDGPALRLLDIAIAAQESQGKLSLDDEIRRYVRTVSGDWIARWNCSVYAATGVLDAVADHIERNRSPDLEFLPSHFLEKVERACDDMDPADYLHTLAETTRTLERQGVPEYWELPMGSWEFLQTFPHLFGLDAILMDDPYCHERAASYTTEAQRALVLFPGPDALKTRLSWATHSRLQEVVDIVNEHMRREHS